MARRKKVSTTISPESYAFLRALIRSRKAENLAQAIDYALDEMRRAENRARLEAATAAQYDDASQEAIDEENQIAADLTMLGAEVDPDA